MMISIQRSKIRGSALADLWATTWVNSRTSARKNPISACMRSFDSAIFHSRSSFMVSILTLYLHENRIVAVPGFQGCPLFPLMLWISSSLPLSAQ